MPEITVEESTEFETIAEMLALSPSLATPPTPARLRSEHRKGAVFLLARYNGIPAGTQCVRKMDFSLSVSKYLFVKEEFRRKGVARALGIKAMEIVDNRFRTPLCYVTTIVTNVRAIAVTRAKGFRVVATFKSPVSERIIVFQLRNTRAVEPITEWEEILLEI